MPLHHLEHYLIQTADLDGTRDWYVNVLGMRVGPNPDFKFPVVWLYIGDTDVLHLTAGGKNVSENRKAYLGQQSEQTYGSGVVDHIAYRCTGLREMMENLQKHGVTFHKRMVSDQGLFQLVGGGCLGIWGHWCAGAPVGCRLCVPVTGLCRLVSGKSLARCTP